MNKDGNEKINLMKEFLNVAIQIFTCMKAKCKIIDENINKNPLYKEYTTKLLSAKTDVEISEAIDYLMTNVVEYPVYSKCQYKMCNTNINNIVVVVLKLYDFYKTKENKTFPPIVSEALKKLKSANSKKKPLFNNYDREINIVLSYITKLT
jgi:hypothetical protein